MRLSFRAAARGSPPLIAAEGLEARTLLATFTVTTTADAGPGSLRQALTQSATGGDASDTIVFAIPGPAGTVQTIRPLTALPPVSGTTLDGTTQPGYAGSPLIEVDGSLAGAGADGLLADLRSVVRGLAINRFGRHGVHATRGEAVLEGNYIGTTADGAAAAPNGGAGIRISGPNVVVGGTTAAQRNVISGNGDAGVWAERPGSGATIRGNYVGTDATGSRAVGNGREGLLLDANVTVGGTAEGPATSSRATAPAAFASSARPRATGPSSRATSSAPTPPGCGRCQTAPRRSCRTGTGSR